MPIHTFKCPNGHTTEKVFLTFGAVVDEIECPAPVQAPDGSGDTIPCGAGATKNEFDVPFAAHLHGDPAGYHKPSPCGRHSYKIVDKKAGNKHAA